MTEAVFIDKNEAHWRALEAHNARLAVGGVKRLTVDEARDFARLFRLAGCHLAYAKTHYPQGQSFLYLNRVVGVAHNYFYIWERSGLSDVKRYFTRGFPLALWRHRGSIALAAALFFLGAFFAAGYVAADASRFLHIMPDGLGEGGGAAAWDYALMSSVIMTNNISVAATAFGLGIGAGVGTVFVLVYNGVIVGGLYSFLAASGGDTLAFFSLILPHGVTELCAIFIAGGGGLTLGRGVLTPGDYTRRHALVRRAKQAVALLPGLALMLVAAGLIEGFFTPLAIAPGVKLAFAAVTAVGLGVYVWTGKREMEANSHAKAF